MDPKEYTIKENDYNTLFIQITDSSVCFTRQENYRDSKRNSNEEFKITNIDKNYISKVEYSSHKIVPNNLMYNFFLALGIILCVLGIGFGPLIANALNDDFIPIITSSIIIFWGIVLIILSILLRKKSQTTSNFNVYGKSDELLYADEFYVENDFIHELIETIYKK